MNNKNFSKIISLIFIFVFIVPTSLAFTYSESEKDDQKNIGIGDYKLSGEIQEVVNEYFSLRGRSFEASEIDSVSEDFGKLSITRKQNKK